MTTTRPDGQADYTMLLAQARALFDGERDAIANAANLAALLYHGIADVNWLGFYFLHGQTLIVGPFQGQPACVRIALGAGVCGTAASNGRTEIVADVHCFDGHIACDPLSRSEIVVPLARDGEVFGVLDVDSPSTGRFGEADRAGLEALAAAYVEASEAH